MRQPLELVRDNVSQGDRDTDPQTSDLIHPSLLSKTQVRMLIQKEVKAQAWHRRKFGLRDLSFPEPRYHLKKTTLLRQDGTSKGHHFAVVPYADDVFQHLCMVGLRMLNSVEHTTEDGKLTMAWLETTVSLASILESYLWEHGSQHIFYGEEALSGRELVQVLKVGDVERQCRNAARFVLDQWDENFLATRSEWGKRGGKKSKRPPVYTVADLAGIEHLSAAEQMKKTGIGKTRIFELRRDLKACVDTNTSH